MVPAVSVIPNVPAAVKLELTVPPPAVAVEVAVIVQTVAEVCTMPVIAEIFVKVKSVPEAVDKVVQVMSSLPVTVNVIVADVEVALDAAKVTVGAVVSAIVTAIRLSVPSVVMVSVVRGLPAVSVIENEPAAVKLELTVQPPAVAVEVAVMVQTVAEVCTMPVIAEIFVKVKSAPEAVDKVEQVMSSLPVTVNVIVAELEVAAERNRVTVGAVVSAVARVVKLRIEP